MRFEHKVVIITGAAGQVGRACVEGFAHEGARIAAVDLQQPPAADLALRANLSDPAELEAALARVETDLGPPDVLVHSAAVYARTPFLEITPENIDGVFAINVRAMLLAGRRVAASLVARGAPGAIVNLTSVSDHVSDAESVAYEASKGAVTMATRAMAVALAPHRIRVNAVGPGSMAKFQELPARDPLDLDDYERRRIPLGRLGTADDVVRAVLFLASDDAAYITGTVLYVDGGSLAKW
jgi:glucose 1-dehydrogenase